MKHIAVWVIAVFVTALVDSILRYQAKAERRAWLARIIRALAFAITFNVGSWVGII